MVIPVFNRLEKLKEALNSVAAQTFANFEVWVVDDYSEENIKGLVKSINDNRFQYHRLSKKGNANVARNMGIEKATGTYIAFLDSDDEWKTNHLQHRVEFMEKNPTVDGLYGSYSINNQTERIARPLKEKETMLDYLLCANPSGTPTFFMKSQAAKETLFDPNLLRHQDYDFLIRFDKNYTLNACKESTVIVHWEEQEHTQTNFKACMEFIKKYKKDIKPATYHHYNENMYKIAVAQSADASILNHYRHGVVHYKKYVSLVKYLEWVKPSNAISKAFHRLRFVLSNLI